MAYVFEHYPSEARRAGWHEQDGRVPQSCLRSAADLGPLAAAASRRLSALPDDADPELRADLDTAGRLVSGEKFRATELGESQLTPLEVLAETDLSAYLRPYAPLPERLDALDAHLSRLPSFLADATRHLPDRLPAGQRLLGAEQAQAQAINISDAVRQLTQDLAQAQAPARGPDRAPARGPDRAPARGPDRGPDGAPDGLARRGDAAERRMAAAQAARAACADFGRAVAATKPSTGLLGPDRLAEFLRITEGIEQHPSDLLEEATAEVRTVLSAVDAAARTLGAPDRRAAYELMEDQVSDGPATEQLAGVIERLADFWRRLDIVSMDTVLPLEIRPAVGVGTAVTVDFSPSPPLEPVRQPHTLYLPEPPPAVKTATPTATPTAAPAAAKTAWSQIRRQYLNDPMIEVLAVHEVYAGHYLNAEAVARGPSVIRACPWLTRYAEGWAHYTEELSVEHGFADGRPLVRLAQLKSALESAVRLLSYLSMHLMRSPFADAADLAARTCDWSAQRAAREVLIVVADPTPAMYSLGKLRIREWRATANPSSRPALKAFHDRLMQCGNAPMATAWRYYLDGQHRVGQQRRPAGAGGPTTSTEVS